MIPRNRIFDPHKVGVYHCFTRCVRQLFLLGDDELTQTKNHHRRKRMTEHLRKLAKEFAIDVLDFSLMENQVHSVLRNRPDIVRSWSNEEAAQRWWRLCPKKDKKGNPRDPRESELCKWIDDAAWMEELRGRLSDISWIMWFWLRKIAGDANLEDGKRGHFVERRFHSLRLEDEAALLACSIYAALNPMRAGMVEDPALYDDGSFTRRVAAHMQRQQRELARDVEQQNDAVPGSDVELTSDTAPDEPDLDCWLAQFFLDERDSHCSGTASQVEDPTTVISPGNKIGSPRVSNTGYLSMTWKEYVEVLNWTKEYVSGMAVVRGGTLPHSQCEIPTDTSDDMASNLLRPMLNNMLSKSSNSMSISMGNFLVSREESHAASNAVSNGGSSDALRDELRTSRSAESTVVSESVRRTLGRLGMTPEYWLGTIKDWDDLFGYVIRTPDLAALVAIYRRERYRGKTVCSIRLGGRCAAVSGAEPGDTNKSEPSNPETDSGRGFADSIPPDD
jgi:hypothetical protein